MSTRKGQAIFVDELLDEGARRAEEDVLKIDPNTKTPIDTLERRLLSERLALSSLVVDDLRKKTNLTCEFDWRRVLETKIDSGVSLQKSFCRLSSICRQGGGGGGGNFDPIIDYRTFQQSMVEKESLELLAHLSRRFAPALQKSLDELQLFPLTQYLFRLRRLSGVAAKKLRVIEASTPALKSSRFLLFDVARKVMGLGLCLLGAKPLAKM